MPTWIFILLFMILALSAIPVSVVMSVRRRSRERLFGEPGGEDPGRGAEAPEEREMGYIRRMLYVSGFRGLNAPQIFVTATAVAATAGGLIGIVLSTSGVLEIGFVWLQQTPGGLGDLFLPVVQIAPFLVFFIIGFVPWSYVRSIRRRRVEQIEQDLPITLELMSTLGEAGLGFDVSINRVLDSQPGQRTLAQELRLYQFEALAGIPRIQCLRRLARRCDVPSLSMLVSALVQAEQVGSSLSEVLRRQADDLRNRRRERAMVAAQSLPVKLVFPLVICFLPSIFVSTLGPAFAQFFRIAENVLKDTR